MRAATTAGWRSDAEGWLDDAMSRRLTGEEAARFGRWLDHLDDEGWVVLLSRLGPIAASISAGYRDVADEGDALGELSLMAVERWIPAFRRSLAAGGAPASLESYLSARLRRHLGEMRRRRRRREALLQQELGGGLGPDDALFAPRAADPSEDAFVAEVVRTAGEDRETRRVLALFVEGFSRAEIADILGTSRPTISRRVAAVAAVVASLVALVALAFVLRTGGREAAAIAPAPPRATPEVGPPMPTLEDKARERMLAYAVDRRATLDACFARYPDLAPSERLPLSVRLDIEWALDGTVLRRTVHGPESTPLRQCIYAELLTWTLEPVLGGGRIGSVEISVGPDPHDPDRLMRGRRCHALGEHQCVVEELEGHDHTADSLAMVVEAYDALGNRSRALQRMRDFIERFPEDPRADDYSDVLGPSGLDPIDAWFGGPM